MICPYCGKPRYWYQIRESKHISSYACCEKYKKEVESEAQQKASQHQGTETDKER